MHRVLSVRSCRTLSQMRFHHSRTPGFEAVWQRRAASAAPAQCQPPPYRLYLAAVPIAAALTILAAQQIPEAHAQAEPLPDEARLLASHKKKDVAEVVRCYVELVQRGHQPSVAAATCAVQAYSALGQHDKAASVLDALQRQGHRPQGMQQIAWADAYCKAGRLDAARYLLQQAVLSSPRDDAAKVARLCDINMRLGAWAAVSATIARAPELGSSDVKWLRSSFGESSIKKKTDADGFANSIMMLAVHRQHAHALAVLKRAHSSGVVPDALISVMMLACCVDAKFDSLRELLSTMATASIKLDVQRRECGAGVRSS
jgi:tetratricopeptide (TPR) repeat protein